MKITLSQTNGLAIRLTDEQAEALVASLQRQLSRRKDLIAHEPAMAAWNDVAHVCAVEFEDTHIGCSVGICAA